MSKPSKLSTWLEHYRRYITSGVVRPKTAEVQLRHLETFFSRYPDRRDPADIFSSDIRDYISIRKSAGKSDSLIRYEISVVKGFYDWLKFNHSVDVLNPAAKAPRTRGPQPVAFPVLSIEEVIQLLNSAEKPLDKILILFGLTVGFRLFEIESLRWNSFEDKFSVVIFGNRRIPLRHDLSSLLEKSSSTRSTDKIYPNLRGRWEKLQRRANLEVPFVSLRNTLALWLLRVNADIQTCVTILGSLKEIQQALDLEPATACSVRKFVESLPLPVPGGDHLALDVNVHIPSEPRPPISLPPNYAVYRPNQTADLPAIETNAVEV